eukprot:3938336-Rhodomonas_salina.1
MWDRGSGEVALRVGAVQMLHVRVLLDPEIRGKNPQVQSTETAMSGPFAPGMRILVFDFDVHVFDFDVHVRVQGQRRIAAWHRQSVCA